MSRVASSLHVSFYVSLLLSFLLSLSRWSLVVNCKLYIKVKANKLAVHRNVYVVHRPSVCIHIYPGRVKLSRA